MHRQKKERHPVQLTPKNLQNLNRATQTHCKTNQAHYKTNQNNYKPFQKL